MKKQNVPKPQRGFILMPVIMLLTLLATVIFLLSRDNASGLATGASQAEATAAMYVAEAGVQHALWQAQQTDCNDYTDITNEAFGDHSYSVVVQPKEGSPVTFQSTAVLAGGASAKFQRAAVPVYSATAVTGLTLQPGPEGKDTFILEEKPDENRGDLDDLITDSESGPNGPDRALLQFDLSAIPDSAHVESALLRLYLYDDAESGDVVEAHALQRDWDEGVGLKDDGVNWNTSDGSLPWSNPGGDYDPVVAGSFLTTGIGWKVLDLTELTRDWVDGIRPNYGLILMSPPASGNNPMLYHSSDSDETELRPKLTVYYGGCECGKECISNTFCDADFEPVIQEFEIDWMPGTNQVTGIDFLPEGIVIDGVTIPAGGGWIMADSGADDFFVTDSAGVTLTTFPVGQSDVRGVAYVEGGDWNDHLAFADKGDDRIYFMDLDGNIQSSIFLKDTIVEEPFGLSYIGVSDSHLYDQHLAFTSKKNGAGEIYIIDQAGGLQKTINVDSFAPDPQGVAHLAGTDKLMVVDIGGVVSIIDFDGVVLNQYNVDTWGLSGMRGTTIHPETCEHVVIDGNIDKIAGLAPFEPPDAESPRLLMVVADEFGLTTQEVAKKALMESWGYEVMLIDDGDNSSAYNAAVAVNDVVFVGEDVSSSSIGTKLTDAPIGVVTEEANLSDEFGLSSTINWGNGSLLDIDDNSHYITQPFATGPLQVLTTASSLADLTGTLAPDLQVLGSAGTDPMLATLEAGAEMFDSSSAAGRRVQLPWGGDNFDLGNLTADGKTIFERALEWGMQEPVRCDADFVANNIPSEFPWMPGTGDLHGIDYLPAGLVVNSVAVPLGGGWVMSDKNEDRLFVTDVAGNPLTDFLISPRDSQGVALVDAGTWLQHFAVADNDTDKVFYLDLDGSLVWSFSLVGITTNPLGLGFISTTASATYDNHLAISSDKNPTGGGTATVYIVDQSGNVKKTIDIEAFAPTPQGVTHVNGADKLIVADKAGMVSVIDFDGNLLHQYFAANLGLTELNEIAVNPMTCEHVVVQKKDFENIVSLDRDTGDGNPRYVEMYLPWSAVTADAWESINLDIYGAPPNAVAEVAVINADGGKELWGGVRTKGSTLERRLQLHEGGQDVMVMHVQTDSSGFIEHYSNDPAKLTFVLLGYWTESTYAENWQTFKAGDNGKWLDHALNGYGVAPNSVTEMLVVNNAGFNDREAGVRRDGSGLSRRIKLHEAMDGGDDAMSMLTVAGSDGGATIEVYAMDDADIDFYLLGHWVTPPGNYTEAFEDLGTANVQRVWEDTDLSSKGVPANAVVQILAANSEDLKGAKLGVRSKGFLAERLLDLHKALNGGDDVATMHVNADANSIIQWYDEDLLYPHTFYLLGWWQLTP